MSQTLRPQARQDDLIVQSAADEMIVYDTSTDKAYVLSPSAAAVLRASNGTRTVQDIAQYLSDETPTDEKTVWFALGQLNELLEEPVTLPQEMAGISRRKFIKMSGAVAAGVAIPLVVKMVAPSPAQAQSFTEFTCECSGGSTPCVSTCADCPARCDALGGQTAVDCERGCPA